ncbi:MAG: LON peptidase substrate-binding domain-containing protein [Bacteroidales bacterium]|nr:LON peptidase substrate-binding domain-containing protein [Bacteroidales bacterium]HRX32444.1 LON peptidase substrate-binding domain-containing protein [Tenuifilaceae bacterium]
MAKKQKNIDMFPLGIFLLPGEDIPLRIFEPRYIQLINEINESKKTFAIPYIKDYEMKLYGSEVELSSIIARNSKSEMVIMVKGVKNFHLLDFNDIKPNKLYGDGTIEYIDDKYFSTNPELAVLIKKLKLNIDPIYGTLNTGSAMNLTAVASSIMLNSEEKYTFYTLRDAFKMERFLLKRLKFIERIQSQEKLLENNFSLN